MDLPARAEALVGEPGVREGAHALQEQGDALGLQVHGAVPVQTDGPQVRHVALGGAPLHPVQVLHAQQEPAAGGARETPRGQGRAEVAQVQVPGGRRREAARGGGLGVAGHHARDSSTGARRTGGVRAVREGCDPAPARSSAWLAPRPLRPVPRAPRALPDAGTVVRYG